MHIRSIVILGCAVLFAVPVAAAPSPTERAIAAAMRESAAGWNAGDVRRFMAVYSNDARASFVTSAGIVRGKPAMIARYRKAYDFTDAAKRGRLSFQPVDFRPLGAGHALYVARYTLSYPGSRKRDTGLTSLVFAREAAGWKIVADHSS